MTSRTACTSSEVVRIVLREHVVEEPARRLQLAVGLRLAGIALEHQARDARDLAELPSPELGGVQTREDVAFDVRRGKQRAERRAATDRPAAATASPKP